MDKRNKALIILIILTVIFTLMGATLAYWNWSSSAAQNTAVTFTVTSGFSCSADGGGSITSNDKQLVPAACTNTTYAIKRTITVRPTITQPNKTIYLDMWLKVKSIGEGLSNSVNMKYALTDSEANCTTGVVSTGNFNGATTNTEKSLLHEKAYSSTTTETYYLWVWLDAAETNSNTMNQTFNIELGGNCTDEAPNYVYTVNLYDEDDEANTIISIGQTIPSGITKFYDPNGATQAITALETAYSNANSGATASLPFYLKHTVGDFSRWCIIMNNDTSNCLHSELTESDCNTVLSQGAPDDGNTYTCSNITTSNAVTESYVGFVVTPAMATANPGMTAGTYYLRGGDNGASFLDNAKTIYDAFGGVGCDLDGDSGGNPYTTTPSSNFYCEVSGLHANAYSHGYVYAGENAGSYCQVSDYGRSFCE